MILKKPYGFLIKHFRMIHLILLAISFYLTMKVNHILQYYNSFIRGSASKLDAIGYVTNYHILAIIVAIVICLIVYALLRYKKKPRILYLLLILLYFLVGVMVQVSYQGLYTIYISVLETKTMLLYRDLLRILVGVQYLSLIFLLIRGLGFDIRKFNFVSDLAELGESEQDSEEFELTLGGTEVTRRKFHRGIRELKYYYLENRTFINIIFIIVLALGLGTFTVNKEVINKVYKEGEAFSSSNFNFNVLNTYVTDYDAKGSMVGDLKHSFVALRISLGGNGGAHQLETGNLILKVGNSSYAPSVRYANYFQDLGVVYQNQNIQEGKTYLFLYSVLKTEIKEKMQLIYANDKVVQLSPVFLDEEEKEVNLKLGDTLNLSDTVLHQGEIRFTSYELKDKFMYSYEYEVRGEKFKSEYAIGGENTAIMLLKISANSFSLDSYASFLSSYGHLLYQVDGKEYEATFYDKTPGNYHDGVYLSTSREVLNASDIWMSIQIRNKKFKYKIK